MKLTKNVRISLYILVPILLWMISGFFKEEERQKPTETGDLFNVQTILSEASEYQPLIKLKGIYKIRKKNKCKSKNIG